MNRKPCVVTVLSLDVPEGTPQGPVLAPLLSNIYLHEVFDRWIVEVVRERMADNMFEVGYADGLKGSC